MKLKGSNIAFGAMRVKQFVSALVLTAVGLMSGTGTHVANAQALSTTTVQGTVYLANGQPGAGTLRVSWPNFTTANGQDVVADSINVTIPSDGFVSVNLTPNLGATPAGLYYTAIFYMSDGTVNTQYWVVPAAAQATLAQVQAQVMPAAQAVQAVSKAYVDESIAEVTQGSLTAFGGTLNGPLYLSSDPTQPLQAATKEYVDAAAAASLPVVGGALTGPVTAPEVNGVYVVDGVTYASVNAALSACEAGSSASCTIDARGGLGSHALGTIIPTKATTILLGAFQDYTANQIVMVSGFHLIGASAGFSTSITSSSTTNQALLTTTQTTIGGTPGSKNYIVGVEIKDIALNPYPGATIQDGIFIDMTSSQSTSVYCFENALFENVNIGQFPGVSIHLRADNNYGHVVQYVTFNNVWAYRASSSTSQTFRAEGDIGQIHFYNGALDAWDWSDGGTNIYLGEYSGESNNVYSITFDGTSIQGGAFLAQLNGANNITFHNTHSEGAVGHTNGFLFTLGGTQNFDIVFDSITVAGTVGQGPYTNPQCPADSSATTGFIFDTWCAGTNNEMVVSNSFIPALNTTVLINNSNTQEQQNIFRDDFWGGVPAMRLGTPQIQLTGSSSINWPGSVPTANILGLDTISTINGPGVPGMTITLIAGQDGVNFNTAGNLSLAAQSTLTLKATQAATFQWVDQNGKWNLVSTDATPSTINGDLAGFTGSNGQIADSGVASSSVVTLTGAQILTNKTLSSPSINGAPIPISASLLGSNSSGQFIAQTGPIAVNISGTAAGLSGSPTVAVSSIAVAGGSAMSANQGTGKYIQHSDGTGTSGYVASYSSDGSLTNGPFDYGVCSHDTLTLYCTLPDSGTAVALQGGSDGIFALSTNSTDTDSQGFYSDWMGDGTGLYDMSGGGAEITEEAAGGGISLEITSTSNPAAISLDTSGTGPINLGANSINNYIAQTYLLKLGSSTNLIDYGVTTAGALTLLNPAIGSATATTQVTSDTSSDVATDNFVHNAISAALPASAGLITTNSSSQAVAATAHNESTLRVCTTTNSGNAYSCSTSPNFTPVAGDSILVDFSAANTGSATLTVNGTSAATIKKWGASSTLAANDVLAGHWISATFDGTYWQLEGQLGNSNATQVDGAAVPASAGLLGSNSSSQLTLVSTLPTSAMPALAGDVTNTAGSLATTVGKVNGSSVPASAACIATNSSSQLVACSSSTGIITGGNDTTRTTSTTMTNSWTTTGLVLPTVPVSTTKSGRCVIYWQMSSTSYSATFGIGMSNAPTGLWGGTSVTYTAAGATNWLAFSQTATTTTAISTGAIAGAASTTYKAEVDFVLQTGASNTVAVTLYGTTSNSGATLTIEPGSTCHWLP